MFLAYIDSSGGSTFNDKENYVLSTVVTNEADWQYIDNGIKSIKLKHFPRLPDSDVEFHAKDMMSRYGIYEGLDWNKIYSILDDVFNFISDIKTNICIISVLIDKKKLRPDKDIETWRSDFFLKESTSILKK